MDIEQYREKEKLKNKDQCDKDAFREVDLEKKKRHAAYMKEYYKRNPEKQKENNRKQRERYKKTPELLEKKRKYHEEYYQKNYMEANEKASYYYLNNAEKIKKYSLQRAYNLKVKAVMILGGKCMKCGWREHPAGLEFHHRDPKTKLFNVTTKQLCNPSRFTWDIILQEIEKCDLLCANCHAIEESRWDISDW